jgi:hypothetical protein
MTLPERNYESVARITREHAIDLLTSGTSEQRTTALLSLAHFDSDWQWVQEQCLTLLTDPDAAIRGTAALCLGHVARIHGELDLARVLPALRRLAEDPAVAGRVNDAIDDIETFIPR